MKNRRPIGIFDSGFGGLTVYKEIEKAFPEYDYIYLGDNARAPYGNRSFETVYEYTLECVKWLYDQGCPLVILACNTASAKALRSIQQNDLKHFDPNFRVLGVIRPTAEVVDSYTQTKHIGILGTQGTVNSGSYLLEIEKLFPELKVFQHACPLWVPFVENNEFEDDGVDYYIKKDVQQLLEQSPKIDTILLACTHYPILMEKIKKYLPEQVSVIAQGQLVANSLGDYLQRHPEIASIISKNQERHFFTTDDANAFKSSASIFLGKEINADRIHL